MKRLVSVLLISVLLFLCSCNFNSEQSQPAVSEKIKAVWIYYNELSMADEHGGNAFSFTNKITEMMKKCKSKGFNTLFVQVRPFGDAFYKSKIFPLSEYLTGEQGKSVDYDPLRIIIDESHKLDLSVHAWINPFRVSFSSDSDKLSSDNPAKKWLDNKSKSVIKLDNGIYYCPASFDAQKLIIDGIKEIVQNYNVDGIHIDDYFYPSIDKNVDLFYYENYRSNGGKLNLSEWRLNIISSFVQSIYDTVKSIDSKCIFSISPAGNIENNYNEQFADVRFWCSRKGYCDWIIPQIYYGFESKILPFDIACRHWVNIKTCDCVKIIFGLAAYRVDGDDEDKEWKSENKIIDRQIEYINKLDRYDGYAMFSYSSIFE